MSRQRTNPDGFFKRAFDGWDKALANGGLTMLTAGMIVAFLLAGIAIVGLNRLGGEDAPIVGPVIEKVVTNPTQPNGGDINLPKAPASPSDANLCPDRSWTFTQGIVDPRVERSGDHFAVKNFYVCSKEGNLVPNLGYGGYEITVWGEGCVARCFEGKGPKGENLTEAQVKEMLKK